MKHKSTNIQRDLFEQPEPGTLPSVLPKGQLATLLETLAGNRGGAGGQEGW
jgi:hypothetical protein